VDIHTPVEGRVQQSLRKDSTIGDHDGNIGFKRHILLRKRTSTQGSRLGEWKPQRGRTCRYRRCPQLFSPAGRLVGLCHNEHDFVARL
jgi:hypothetical protein